MLKISNPFKKEITLFSGWNSELINRRDAETQRGEKEKAEGKRGIQRVRQGGVTGSTATISWIRQ
jgi:hypothetical protein